MKEDLQALVNYWAAQSFIHEQRSVTQQARPGVHGELLLVLRIEMAVTVGKRTATVSCRKLFHTYENSSTAPISPGDCFRFNRQSADVDTEFGDRYEALLDELIKDQYGDGFADPV